MKKYAREKEEGNGRLCVWKRVMGKEEKGGEWEFDGSVAGK